MTDRGASSVNRAALFAGGGDMGRRILAHDWAATPLGPIDGWDAALLHGTSLMLAASAEIVLFWGPDHIALYNDAYAPTIGTKHPAALGRPARESWSELWDDLRPLLDHVRDTGETFSAKSRRFYIERAGYGEDVFFDVSYSAVRGADGAIEGVLCIVAETTEQVRARDALTRERMQLVEMFDSAPSFMAVLRGPSHVFDLANRSCLALIGRGEEIIGQPLLRAVPEIAEQGLIEILDTVRATGRTFRAEGRSLWFVPEGGEAIEHILDFVYQPMTDAAGQVTGIFVEGIDNTERHRAEGALRESREAMALAAEAAEIGTWSLDPRTGELRWDGTTKAMFGISLGVPVSLDDLYAGIHPDDAAQTLTAFEAALDPGRRASFESEFRTLGAEDGRLRWVAARGRAFFEDGVCIRATGTALDITDRHNATEALRESEQRFRTLADTAPALIWLTDSAGGVEFANRSFETLLGVTPEEMVRDGWLRIVAPEMRARMTGLRDRVRAGRKAFSGDIRVIDVAGQSRWIHVEGRPRLLGETFQGYIACAVDITEAHLAGEALERRIAERTAELAEANRRLTEQIAERQRAEEALHQLQRLEAVGQLTSGVAHDFNNLLTVIVGNVEMIERAGIADDRQRRRLQHVRAAADRGAALTAQLLAFARRSRLEAKAVDLNRMVAGMRDMLDRALGGTVAVTTRLGDDLWPAMVDATQMELIVLNLAINARDAMPGGGTITIGTRNVAIGGAAGDAPELPPPGDYVCVSVSDTGTGMPPEVRARVFEPFFTTKPVGKGSGLGLAQVYGVARQSGGGVTIESAPGEGTVVRVFLPRADAAPPITVEIAPASAPADAVGRTVLVLDDDDPVREVAAGALRDAGFRVVEAAAGEAALAAIEADERIALVLADFAMPAMNGVEFAERAARLAPHLPVLFATGYADLGAIADISEERIVQKPYRSVDLVARVRRALSA